jgi:hypothetical protein
MILQVLKTSIKLSTYGALPLSVIPLLFPAGFSNLQLRFPRYVSKMVFFKIISDMCRERGILEFA